MSRKRKNAGEGYGYMFSGAFSKKADAVAKEKKRKGSFVKGIPTPRGYRYVVMTPRDNPVRRKKIEKQNPVLFDSGIGMFSAWRRDKKFGTVYGSGHTKKAALHDLRDRLRRYRRGETVGGGRGYFPGSNNPMDLVVMGAGVPNPAREIVMRPGESVTLRVNPSGRICGHMVGGLPCSREPGHKGPHLPQGATLRPSSRHNWGRRANPAAETIRESFTGMPVETIDSYREPHMPASNYALLGNLLLLGVKPIGGGQWFKLAWSSPEERPLVVSDESARQIWFVGGDQDLTLEELERWGARDLGAGRYELGEAREIHYRQHKAHAPDPGPRYKKDEWQHPFGQENGIRPTLLFDSGSKRLLLEGGDYRIEQRGIVN